MKFCKHCGSQLPDNAVCNCPGAVSERQAMGGYPPQTHRQRPQTPVPQSKRIVQNLLEPLKTMLKDPKAAVEGRIREKDLITPAVYTGALFLIVLGACCCIYGTHAAKSILVPGDALSMGKGIVDFHFGLALLAALLLTLGMCALYAATRFVILLLFGKQSAKPLDLLLGSLVSFGVNSIVPMCLILAGGLFYMASSTFGWVFFILATVWYIVAGLFEIKDDLMPGGNALVRLVVIAGVTGVSVALFFLLYQGMFVMNVRVIAAYASDYESLIQLSKTSYSGYSGTMGYYR